MKLLILFIILLFSTLQFPQGLYGFENIRFTASKEYVISQMLKVEDDMLGYERNDVLGFSGGEYISYKVYFWTFHFYNDELHTVDVVFRQPKALQMLRDDIIDYITGKYGIESSERLDSDENLGNTWYFQGEINTKTDFINLNLYETSTGETTYKLTFVNIKLFQTSEEGGG